MNPRSHILTPHASRWFSIAVCCAVLFSSGPALRAQSFQAPGKAPASLPSSQSASGDSSGAFNSDFTHPAMGAGSHRSDGVQQLDIPLDALADPEKLAQLPAVILGSAVAATNPQGEVISASSRSLTRAGNAWTPVMGEFHYARHPAAEWRDALLMMKSGGVDIVSTDIFWIHHEETEGRFDWSGDRDLRRFVRTCGEAGMQVVLRIGPWCHGGARNGGLPEWLVASGCRLRSDDPQYLEKTRFFFAQIAAQTAGLLWKDGGPVVGIQIENGYTGTAQHLLTLKQIAIDAGLLVPLYVRTGWPALLSPAPPGEFVPTYGVYAEGFWDRELTPMPGDYWAGFRFSTLRQPSNIAAEMRGGQNIADDSDTASYPYLTSEIGGGMVSAYHRRIRIDPRDVESTALVKLGSGSVQPGYYMYHGGVNPDAATPGFTLQENQSARFTNWNDLPEKNYDFQAPLGAGGEVRAQFHLLRRQHLFVHDFGYMLPGMTTILPGGRPIAKDDNNSLRWALRSNGRSGFIFVNNYERHRPLPVHRGVQFALNLPPVESLSPLDSRNVSTGQPGSSPDALRRAAAAELSSKRLVPLAPVDIPANTSFIWPFNLDLGNGAILAYATAQLLCHVETPDGKTRTYFFSEIPGIPPELAFSDVTVRLLSNTSGRHRKATGLERITNVKTGRSRAITLRSPYRDAMTIQIVVLPYDESLHLYKLPWGDTDRVFLSPHPVTIDTEDTLRVHSPEPGPVDVYVYPLPPKEPGKKKSLFARLVEPLASAIKETGSIFSKITVPVAPEAAALAKAGAASPRVEKIRDAGPPREIPRGNAPKPVAAAPADADFAAAAAWKITLPAEIIQASRNSPRLNSDAGANPKHHTPNSESRAMNPLLRIHYTGDVARVLLGGKVILDDFFNGLPLDVPLARFSEKLAAGEQLTLEILPLRKDAPIMLPDSAHPRFGARDAVVDLRKVELVHTYAHALKPVVAPEDNSEKDE